MLPASESHHHAQPGGLLIHLFEVLNHALGIRTSYTLPRGVPPEDIHKLQHLWTYGVFVGALLHDIGKPMADLQITARAGHRSWPWHPLSGSLVEGGAETYRVAFQADRASFWALVQLTCFGTRVNACHQPAGCCAGLSRQLP